MESLVNVRAALLWALGELGPSHGGALAAYIKEQTGGAILVGDGSLYPQLAALVELEMARERRSDGSRRRTYELTSAGRAEVKSIGRVLRRMALAVPADCKCGAYGSQDCELLRAIAAQHARNPFGCGCGCHRRFGLHAPPAAAPVAKPSTKPGPTKAAARPVDAPAPPPRVGKPAKAGPVNAGRGRTARGEGTSFGEIEAKADKAFEALAQNRPDAEVVAAALDLVQGDQHLMRDEVRVVELDPEAAPAPDVVAPREPAEAPEGGRIVEFDPDPRGRRRR